MGHMLTPHVHAEAENIDPCIHSEEEARTLIDMIACFFHPDLGSDHLEEFTGSEDAQPSCIIFPRKHLSFYVSGPTSFGEYQPVFTGGQFAIPPPQRGPPAVA